MAEQTYQGIYNDEAGGLTPYGRTVMDAWVFEIIPPAETCAGWSACDMEDLSRKVAAAWARYDNEPRNLPDDLRMRHAMIYEQAHKLGGEIPTWDPDIDGDD